jgi:hypothetical protein
MMGTYTLPAGQLPVLAKAEVVVVGGGPGGLGSAIMAARQGAQVILIERFGFLGGMAVAGEVHPFMPNHVGPEDARETLDRPIYSEWVEQMRKYLPPSMQKANPRSKDVATRFYRMINKEQALLAAEDLCVAAGVKLLYHHTLVGVTREHNKIKAVTLYSKSGFSVVEGDVFIDATGDADLAALAGCRFEYGGPGGHCQPMTLCFKLGNVDIERMPSRHEINAKYRAAVERGDIDCPRENVLYFNCLEPNVIHFNTTRIIKHSAIDGVALSDAEITGRHQVRQLLAFLRKEIAGFEEAKLHSMAHHMGVRERRRVVGRKMLTREAFTLRQKFADGIARVQYDIDIHNPDGSGTEIETMPPDEWYEIPYGCLVPEAISNLLIAGRPISVDHAIHSSSRVMPPAISIGQAAGMAAAMAVKKGCQPDLLDGSRVRSALREAGAYL